jgi:hypothetical protein
MIKTILVPTGGSTTDSVVFETALAVARPWGAHLEFFHARVNLGQAIRYTPHASFARGQGLRNELHELQQKVESRYLRAGNTSTNSARNTRSSSWTYLAHHRPRRRAGMKIETKQKSPSSAEHACMISRLWRGLLARTGCPPICSVTMCPMLAECSNKRHGYSPSSVSGWRVQTSATAPANKAEVCRAIISSSSVGTT